MPVIMVEGVDRIGKSSLCDYLINSHGYRKIHFSKPEGESHQERSLYQKATFSMMFEFLRSISGSDVKVVLDRGHIGELVYGPMYRKHGIDVSYIHDMEKMYGPFSDVLLVLLTHDDPDEMLKERGDDGESFDPNNISKEQNMFIDAYDCSLLKKRNINVTGKDVYQVREDLLKHIKEI